mgnify:FL=1
MTDPKREEEDWIAACIRGDSGAQRKLFGALFPYLKGAVQRYIFDEDEIQDVLQEAFILIFKNIDMFDAKKGKLRSWASRIAINVAITQGKRRQRIQELPGQTALEVKPSAIETLALSDLISVLKGMPKEQYEVINLYIVEGYSHKEIGEMLGIAAELSRQRLTRAKKWVMERFKLSGGELVPKMQNLS